MRIFVELIQAVWEHGSLPEQMKWVIIVYLPKGGGDYCGIGLLEPFWKVIEKIMVARLLLVKFHGGTGTATIEAKLHKSLAWRDQSPLYQIYIDLKKAYDTLDRERTLGILAAYGVGPKLLALQKHFWETATLVYRAGGNYGEPFGAERGVTQGVRSRPLFLTCVSMPWSESGSTKRLVKKSLAMGSGIVWSRYWWRFTLSTGLSPLGTQFGCRNPSMSSSDYSNGLVCSRMQPRRRRWYAFRGR